jgi:hypothetical protein
MQSASKKNQLRSFFDILQNIFVDGFLLAVKSWESAKLLYRQLQSFLYFKKRKRVNCKFFISKASSVVFLLRENNPICGNIFFFSLKRHFFSHVEVARNLSGLLSSLHSVECYFLYYTREWSFVFTFFQWDNSFLMLRSPGIYPACFPVFIARSVIFYIISGNDPLFFLFLLFFNGRLIKSCFSNQYKMPFCHHRIVFLFFF